MADVERYDDPMWANLLGSRLKPYLESVRAWWKMADTIHVTGTGVFPVKGEGVPKGLYYRVSSSPARSPIKNVQLFPFIPVVYLQIAGVAGGTNRMVSKVCAQGFTADEFTVIEKHSLPGTYHQGQFVALVPTVIIEGLESLGRWIYFTHEEQLALIDGKIPRSVMLKLDKKSI